MPLELGAAPFHDYNEKILAECYRPNAELGNFERLSFDIGPTLALWMKANHPSVLDVIAQADRRAVERTGYGNALVQSFHHTILPLASPRDRTTELRWGIRWFEKTFGRRPLGIWLPETAVDTATLEACVDEGLAFTILSPEQAESSVDTRQAYRIDLPSGRSIDALFYEGPLSGTVSFNPHDTDSAEAFMHRFVLPRLDSARSGDDDPLVVIASDGEVYGHHHRFKDYFLQDLLNARAAQHEIEVVSAECFLSIQRSRQPVLVKERSSWGCGHQLLRWSGDCYCTPGDGAWKAKLREVFDRLAERVDVLSEDVARAWDFDPWSLRDSYIDVVIGETPAEEWLARNGIEPTSDRATVVHALMEAQRYRLAMYASCAFYWDDLTRLEAGYGVRSAQYAAALLDRQLGTHVQQELNDDLGAVIGWKSEKSAAELYAESLSGAR
ncbi:MAG TPA: DUF3536 domain-containing protein [Nitrolancea sp.]|nr:DUF3536 domain-containing protein [Nitrolancea sp.]